MLKPSLCRDVFGVFCMHFTTTTTLKPHIFTVTLYELVKLLAAIKDSTYSNTDNVSWTLFLFARLYFWTGNSIAPEKQPTEILCAKSSFQEAIIETITRESFLLRKLIWVGSLFCRQCWAKGRWGTEWESVVECCALYDCDFYCNIVQCCAI